MSLHDKAIKHIATMVDGQDNHHNSKLILYDIDEEKGHCRPDIISRGQQIHEVEALNHKFTKEKLRRYSRFKRGTVVLSQMDMGELGRPKHAVCWLVIGDYEILSKTFNEIRVLGETARGFIELHKKVVESG